MSEKSIPNPPSIRLDLRFATIPGFLKGEHAGLFGGFNFFVSAG